MYFILTLIKFSHQIFEILLPRVDQFRDLLKIGVHQVDGLTQMRRIITKLLKLGGVHLENTVQSLRKFDIDPLRGILEHTFPAFVIGLLFTHIPEAVQHKLDHGVHLFLDLLLIL